jgi:hypothetical protein
MHAFDLAEFIQNVTLVIELFRLQAKLGGGRIGVVWPEVKKGRPLGNGTNRTPKSYSLIKAGGEPAQTALLFH